MPLDRHPECHPAYYKRNQRTQSIETTSFRAYISQHTVATQWAKLSQLDAQIEISKAGLLQLIFNCFKCLWDVCFASFAICILQPFHGSSHYTVQTIKGDK